MATTSKQLETRLAKVEKELAELRETLTAKSAEPWYRQIGRGLDGLMRYGSAFVEMQDTAGRPIPGFTRADCEEVGGNFVDQCVYWKGNPDMSSLAGRPVRIRIELRRAKLYVFPFTRD